ncbi:MAG TPA: DUF1810 domain-containing protein [Candidatus Didemnitutus sp.]|jgi:uncharacterized protein (DUF1810 family)
MNDDPYLLERFVAAQRDTYEIALEELKSGSKRNHWMGFVFPQVAGLGSNTVAVRYAIKSRQEAKAYLSHPILGPRLMKCVEALLQIAGKSAEEVMGDPDDLKLKSSLTLFAAISTPGSLFHATLDRYFSGEADPRTLKYLAAHESDSKMPNQAGTCEGG